MNITAADQQVGFTGDPSTRGTIGLVWNCFVTVFLCTWTVQRPNIPSPSTSPRPAISVAGGFTNKLFWMFVTMVVPEYVALVAYYQWKDARISTTAPKICDRWSLVHGYYAEMGGFAVRLNYEPRFQASESGFVVELQDGVAYRTRAGDLRTMVSEHILTIPEITTESIYERSKATFFANVITLIQVLWFVVCTLGRVAQRLPISTLELSTLAFVCCAAVIGFFWWHKPLDLRSSTVIMISPDKERSFVNNFDRLEFSCTEQELAEQINAKSFFSRAHDSEAIRYGGVHFVWIGCLFNGIQVAAWNFVFATFVEQVLWRACSIAGCVCVIASYVFLFIPNRTFSLALNVGLITPIYTTARLFLIVQVLVGLRSLPKEVYQNVNWSSFLPHI